MDATEKPKPLRTLQNRCRNKRVLVDWDRCASDVDKTILGNVGAAYW